MELSEKDMHCLARLLQGELYEDNKLFCCRGYCKYSGECVEDARNHKKFQYNILREHLEAVTGVYLGYLANPEYVYKRMMKDSYFEANGIDPFKSNLETNCPQCAMDWVHAKGLKEKAARFRSMLRIKGRKAKWAARAFGIRWGSFAKAKTKMFFYRLKNRRKAK